MQEIICLKVAGEGVRFWWVLWLLVVVVPLPVFLPSGAPLPLHPRQAGVICVGLELQKLAGLDRLQRFRILDLQSVHVLSVTGNQV